MLASRRLSICPEKNQLLNETSQAPSEHTIVGIQGCPQAFTIEPSQNRPLPPTHVGHSGCQRFQNGFGALAVHNGGGVSVPECRLRPVPLQLPGEAALERNNGSGMALDVRQVPLHLPFVLREQFLKVTPPLGRFRRINVEYFRKSREQIHGFAPNSSDTYGGNPSGRSLLEPQIAPKINRTQISVNPA